MRRQWNVSIGLWVECRLYKYRLPLSRHSSDAIRRSRSDAGGYDVGTDVVVDVSFQQQQHDLHGWRLDAIAATGRRRRTDDRQQVRAVIKGGLYQRWST